jgi:periplasmic divalent cation tolerance protein
MTDKIVILSTCSSEEEAATIARQLVERRSAACVQIVPGLRSFYRWKDEIQDDAECLLIIKSRRDIYPLLEAQLRKLHSYEIPEIVALQIVEGADAYLRWIDREL